MKYCCLQVLDLLFYVNSKNINQNHVEIILMIKHIILKYFYRVKMIITLKGREIKSILDQFQAGSGFRILKTGFGEKLSGSVTLQYFNNSWPVFRIRGSRS